MVTVVASDQRFSEVVNQWVARLARGATQAHAAHKALPRTWASGGIEAADALIPELAASLMRTGDAAHGVAATVQADASGMPRGEFVFTGHRATAEGRDHDDDGS